MPIEFEIQTIYVGKDQFDHVTPRRKIILNIKPENDEQLNYIKEKYETKELTFDISKHDEILNDLVETKNWTVNEIPKEVIHVLKLHENFQMIPDDEIESKIGPRLWNLLHPFQKTCVRFTVSKRRAYIADEMGSGKTLEALASCAYYSDLWPVLVICPSSLRYTWKSEIEKWLNIDNVYVVDDTKTFLEHFNQKEEDDDETTEKKQKRKKRKISDKKQMKLKNALNHKFCIVSYDLARNENVENILLSKYKVLVIDECHYIKCYKSQRSKSVLKYSREADIVFMLSGTPFSYPHEIFTQLKAIQPHMFLKFFEYPKASTDVVEEEKKKKAFTFADRYCKPLRQYVGNREEWIFRGYDRPAELYAVLSTVMVRRRKHEILSQLPEKNRICITLSPLSDRQLLEIKELLDQRNEEELSINDKNSSYMQSFRLTCGYKIPKVIEFLKKQIIEDYLVEKPDDKILIFMHHKVMGEAIEELLKEKELNYFVINGNTSSEKRQEYANDFQTTDKYQIALLSITAAGTGLTLTAASCEIFTEILFGPDQHAQAEDRAHRIGQKNNVNIFYLIQPDSTDEINFNLLKKKEFQSSRCLDGKGNVLESNDISQETTNDDFLTAIKNIQEQRKKKESTANSYQLPIFIKKTK